MELDPVDLAAVARQALPVLETEAAAAGVVLRSSLEEAVVEGNDVLLHQVVTNLVQNGIRHNVDRGGVVAVTVGAGRLVVRNTGVVLDAAQVATFVEPFAKDRYGVGHGLGLALVARIVEAHHGKLELLANPDGGLTATVTLPEADLVG